MRFAIAPVFWSQMLTCEGISALRRISALDTRWFPLTATCVGLNPDHVPPTDKRC